MNKPMIDSCASHFLKIEDKINEHAESHKYELEIGSELASVFNWIIVLIGILYFIRLLKEYLINCKKESNRKIELNNAKNIADTRICHQTILELSKTANSEQIQSELKNLKEKLEKLENLKK